MPESIEFRTDFGYPSDITNTIDSQHFNSMINQKNYSPSYTIKKLNKKIIMGIMVYGQGHLSLEGPVAGQPPVVLRPMDLGARCTTQEVNKSRRAVNGGNCKR